MPNKSDNRDEFDRTVDRLATTYDRLQIYKEIAKSEGSGSNSTAPSQPRGYTSVAGNEGDRDATVVSGFLGTLIGLACAVMLNPYLGSPGVGEDSLWAFVTSNLFLIAVIPVSLVLSIFTGSAVMVMAQMLGEGVEGIGFDPARIRPILISIATIICAVAGGAVLNVILLTVNSSG